MWYLEPIHAPKRNALLIFWPHPSQLEIWLDLINFSTIWGWHNQVSWSSCICLCVPKPRYCVSRCTWSWPNTILLVLMTKLLVYLDFQKIMFFFICFLQPCNLRFCEVQPLTGIFWIYNLIKVNIKKVKKKNIIFTKTGHD